MYSTFNSLKIALVASLLTVFAVGFAHAKINPPQFEYAEGKIFDVRNNSWVATISLGWSDKNENPDGFAIYIYEGQTKNLDDFKLYKRVAINDEDLISQRNNYNYTIREYITGAKVLSVYIRTLVGDDHSEASIIKYISFKNQEPPKLFFNLVGRPDLYASIDEEYKAVFNIESYIEYSDLEIKFDYAPEGAEFDQENMLVTWTPTESGMYKFILVATAIGPKGEKLNAGFAWHVEVKKCKEPATLSGTVTDVNGTKNIYGTATLFSADDPNYNNSKLKKVYDARIVDGNYIFDNVDAGKYYLQINSYSENQRKYPPMWYKNAVNFMDATPIEIDCADVIEGIDFVVEQIKEPEFYKISGKVVDAESLDPLRWIHIQFIGLDSRNNHYKAEAVTDQFGEYSVKLPEAEYIAVATAIGRNSMSGQYFPQYYKLAKGIQDATIIELKQNISGIDFALDKIPSYENYITGKVVNTDGVELPDVVVSAYCIEPEGKNDKFRFHSQSAVTDESGNFKMQNLIPGTYVLFAAIRDKVHMPGFYVEGEIVSPSWKDASEIAVEESGSFGPYKLTLPLFEKVYGEGRIRGFVRERKGSAKIGGDEVQGKDGLHGANVYIFDEAGNPVKSTATNADGSFELNMLPLGTYTVILDKVGFYPHTYTISLNQERNDFSDEVEMSPISTTSINSIYEIANSVFPNPVSEMLNITFEGDGTIANIKISNINGEILLHEQKISVSGSNHLSFPATQFSSGTYFLTIELNGKALVTPIVIIK